MSSFQFQNRSERVSSFCKSTISLLSSYKEEQILEWITQFESFLRDYQKQTNLTLAFIGQYNAGKSTLIKALTGNNSIRVSAEICTDRVTEYAWQDVLLVDTPGVYAGREDHDQITLDRISKSDLLVFVVPNELFNPQGGSFFRKVAQDMQRVGQMVLVVNKMSRERGNVENLTRSLLEITEPFHPQDFYICFIDSNCYLKARYETDVEEKKMLIEDSNFDTFLDSLQTLIEKNRLTARLITPLNKAVELLEKSRNFLSTDNQKVRDLLELLRRKVLLLRASAKRFQNEFRSKLKGLEYEVAFFGDEIASMIDGHHSEEEINREITNSQRKVEIVSQRVLQEIQDALTEEFQNLQSQLEELETSPLARSLKEFTVSSVEGKQVSYVNGGDRSTIPNYLKNSTQSINALSRFTSTVSRDLVYSVGKFFGVKFKPWGAVRTAKVIRGVGPAVAGLGVALEIFLAAKEEKDRVKHEQELRDARIAVRREYKKIASEMRNEYEANIKTEILTEFYDAEIRSVIQQQNESQSSDSSREDILQKIDGILREIKREISFLD
jgi:GTPase SAR1 family protein